MAADKAKSRLIVACPHCKARFDVSAFRPGSKIRCGSCYKILRIPDRTRDGLTGPTGAASGVTDDADPGLRKRTAGFIHGRGEMERSSDGGLEPRQ